MVVVVAAVVVVMVAAVRPNSRKNTMHIGYRKSMSTYAMRAISLNPKSGFLLVELQLCPSRSRHGGGGSASTKQALAIRIRNV